LRQERFGACDLRSGIGDIDVVTHAEARAVARELKDPALALQVVFKDRAPKLRRAQIDIGACDIALQCRRSFQPDAPAGSFALHIRVTQ